MDFRLTDLPAGQFSELRRATDDQLRRRGVERRIVDRSYSPLCCISLQDAEVGKEVLLVIPAASIAFEAALNAALEAA